MGNFLDAPITEKTTEVGEDESKGMWVGMSCMQGWRAQMEDDHLITLSLPEVSIAATPSGCERSICMRSCACLPPFGCKCPRIRGKEAPAGRRAKWARARLCACLCACMWRPADESLARARISFLRAGQRGFTFWSV